MVVSDESSTNPKRRRIDNGPNIAQSNATLQFLTGRQNRWLDGIDTLANQDAQTSTRVRAAEGTATSIASDKSRASGPTANNVSNAVNAGGRLHQRRNPSNAHASTPPPLVQYETGTRNGHDYLNLADQLVNGRNPASAVTMPSNQTSLPSPVSSEDMPHHTSTAPPRRGRPPGSRNRMSNGAIPPGVNPTARLNPTARPTPLQNTQPPQPNGHHPNYQQQQPYHGQVIPVQHPHGHSFRQPSIPGTIPPHGQTPMFVQTPYGLVPAPQVLPSNVPPTPRPLPVARVSKQTMLQQLAAKEDQMNQASTLTGNNPGRIALLREAVENEDWFYQVVSQLFCLRTCSPRLLPQSLQDVNDQSFSYLEQLICSNNTLQPDLVEFFADFPEPIMQVYSDGTGARELFEHRVQSVKECLNRLPVVWDKLIESCRIQCAPPLVQDMHSVMYLRSPTLQSAFFRLVARLIYGNNADDTGGVVAIEKLHEIDKETFYRQQFRRTPVETTQVYTMLGSVYHFWQQHKQKRASGQQVPDFHLQPEYEAFFRTQPLSLIQNQQQQHQQHASSPRPQPQQSMAQQQPSNTPPLHQQMQAQLHALANGRSNSLPHLSAHMHQRAMSLSTQTMNPPGRQSPTTAASPHPLNANNRPGSRLLFPRAGDAPRPQPTHPEWTRSGLHQVHLRSPVLVSVDHKLDASKLYRHVLGFSVPPTLLKKAIPAQVLTFTISPESMSRIPRTSPPVFKGGPSSRNISETSLLYRLRCSIMPRSGLASESAWVTTENYWPEELSFKLNGTVLETRRKLHHGRDLPIDLTHLLQVGQNQLRVCRRMRSDSRSTPCLLAIEVVGVKSHENIKENLTHVSAAESLSAIKKSLGASDQGDDDVAVTSSALTITLFDPYSNCRIFDIPVRGSSCLHRDCFDLETFLQLCKRTQPEWPTVIDCWRCPICRGDVRPQTLVVDDFLVHVRGELENKGLLNTRAIIVDADGSWRPKPEEMTGVRSPSLEREERGSLPRQSATTTPAPQHEVIEID